MIMDLGLVDKLHDGGIKSKEISVGGYSTFDDKVVVSNKF